MNEIKFEIKKQKHPRYADFQTMKIYLSNYYRTKKATFKKEIKSVVEKNKLKIQN